MRSAIPRRLLAGIILTAAALLALTTSSAFAVATATTGSASNVTATTATLSGTVTASDSDTAYSFVYGTTTNYTGKTTPVVAKVGANTATATITGLQPNTTYHFEIIADDAVVEPVALSQGGDATFTTLPAPVATTGAATNVKATSATLTGLANPTTASEYAFQYGTSTTYATQTPAGTIPAGAQQVQTAISGLSPGTIYHFRLVVVQLNPLGPAYDFPAAGSDVTFTTPSGSNPSHKHKRKHRTTSGKVSLRSGTIRVIAGQAAVHLRCRGGSSARCAGNIALRVKSKGAGSQRFFTHGGRAITVRVPLTNAALSALAAAPHRTVGARLTGTFSTHQRKLKRKVTLIA